ncbi:MAG: SCP2 sterol-binding domain-containing protein [Leptolyngbyaceae cyanobacterium]
MAKFDDHPTVRRLREQQSEQSDISSPTSLDRDWLRTLCLDKGADDVGFVSIDQPDIADQRAVLLKAFPHTKTLISFVCRMNRDNVQSPARSIANVEFHHTGEAINNIARKVVRALEDQGVRAINPAMGFPMEAQQFPDKCWVISHKPVAVAAGLGHMGIHRNVIHPKFGNFILLGTVLMDAEVTHYNQPIDYNPCVECKLCVAACPVGAIGANGSFNFSACYTHNYREFLGGFGDWAKTVAESKSAKDYERKVGESDSAALWQSLSFGANYKAAYCLASCPAGEDVMMPFLKNRKRFINDVVKPLQDKSETVYVIPGSDAETHVARRFPHKQAKQVRNSLVPKSINGFVFGLSLVFQPNQAKGLNAVYQFTFTGEEPRQITVVVRNQMCDVHDGHVGQPNLLITADSQTWIKFLGKESNLAWALLRRKIRLKGDPRLLLKFAKCFPT